MEFYKGIKEPVTSLIWLYPRDNGEHEIRIWGSNGWKPVSSISDEQLEETSEKVSKAILEKLGNQVVPEGGQPGQWLTVDEEGNTVWANLDLTDVLAYGVEWDITQTTPVCTRVGNSLLHKSLPIQNGFKGCVHNKGIVNYYLYPEDWAFKEDGSTASNLDGTDGYVGVDTGCEFYGKSFILGNKRRVYVSTTKIDSSWVTIPRLIIDAWHPTLDRTDTSNIKLACVVNTTTPFRGGGNRAAFDDFLETDPCRSDLGKAATSMSRGTARNYAFNSGGALLNYEYYKWIKYWLYVIEYANFNSQATYNSELTSDGYAQGGLGPGVTTIGSVNWSNYNGYYSVIPCGYTNSIGNRTGTKSLTIDATTKIGDESITIPSVTFQVPRWRGFENPFGDVWTILDAYIAQNNQDTVDDSGNCAYKNVYSYRDPLKILGVNSTTELSALQLDKITEDYSLIAQELNKEGYIGDFDLGSTAEIIPNIINGGVSTRKCDYHGIGNKQDSNLRTLVFGGTADNGSIAGLGYCSSYYSVGFGSASYGLLGYYLYKK